MYVCVCMCEYVCVCMCVFVCVSICVMGALEHLCMYIEHIRNNIIIYYITTTS